MMAGIRGTDTKPELMIRTALFSAGFRYRKNCGDLPGKPDIKLTRYRAVIFVHGCFWHGHDCRFFRMPGSNVEFWSNKIGLNRERDARDIRELISSGWRVCVIWECVTRSATFLERRPAIIELLTQWIASGEPFLELYDSMAMNKKADMDGQATHAVGMNIDAGLFVAERSVPYQSRKSD
jgi:DNA mismatch endonuclease (patch repair protein)